MAVLVLSTTDWRRIRRHTQLIADAIAVSASGAYLEIAIPADG